MQQATLLGRGEAIRVSDDFRLLPVSSLRRCEASPDEPGPWALFRATMDAMAGSVDEHAPEAQRRRVTEIPLWTRYYVVCEYDKRV